MSDAKDEIEKIKRACEEMQKSMDKLNEAANYVYRVRLPAAVYTKIYRITTNPQLFNVNFWN